MTRKPAAIGSSAIELPDGVECWDPQNCTAENKLHCQVCGNRSEVKLTVKRDGYGAVLVREEVE